jgi:hypothetical protein
MAKKSRRARPKARTIAKPVRISPPSHALASEAAPKEVDFSKEYHYVIEDLRRIAITAAALLVLLLVLAFLVS